jgi:hypothetical protein
MSCRALSLVMASALVLSAPRARADDKPAGSDTPSGATFRQGGALLDRSPQRRPFTISVFAGAPYAYYYYGVPFGVGGRFMIPIVHDGFIPPLNDSFGIEFGADLYGTYGVDRRFYTTFGLPVEVYWQFHFTSKFSAYVKVGAVLEFNFVPYTVCAPGAVVCRGYVYPSPIGNAGIIFRFTKTVSFRAEAGYPWVKIGFGFDL